MFHCGDGGVHLEQLKASLHHLSPYFTVLWRAGPSPHGVSLETWADVVFTASETQSLPALVSVVYAEHDGNQAYWLPDLVDTHICNEGPVFIFTVSNFSSLKR